MTTIVLGSGFFVVLVLGLAMVVMLFRRWLLPMRPLRVLIRNSKTIMALRGQTLLRALQEAGLNLPAACGGTGSCGQCRVRVLAGAGDVLPIERARLRKAELAQGDRLACQLVLNQSIEVELDQALLQAERWPCRILSCVALAPWLREIVIGLPPGVELKFRPGSYVMVHAPPFRVAYSQLEPPAEHRAIWRRMQLSELVAVSREPVSRAYSIANVPSDGRQRIVLLVRLALPPPDVPEAPPGKLSSWLFARHPGDLVDVSGPFGEFGAQESEREMIFVGGGVGMAPLRAIISDLLQNRRTRRTISFWYGARCRNELFYRDEFDALATTFEEFRWTVALSDPVDDDWQGERGFIHEVLLRRYLRNHPAPNECEYYLCGPPLMIKAVLAMLDRLGVAPERIFNDDFGSR